MVNRQHLDINRIYGKAGIRMCIKGSENMADTVYFSKIEYCEVIGYGHTTSKVLGVHA